MVKRPTAPGAQICARCKAMTDNTQLQHISVWRKDRKRGWICDECVELGIRGSRQKILYSATSSGHSDFINKPPTTVSRASQ